MGEGAWTVGIDDDGDHPTMVRHDEIPSATGNVIIDRTWVPEEGVRCHIETPPEGIALPDMTRLAWWLASEAKDEPDD
jgi:hypothetical protein